MKYLWLATLLFCPGCIATQLHVEQGIVSQSVTIERFGRESLEASIDSARYEGIYQVVGPFYGTVGIGPSLIQPTDGKATALALDTAATFYYADWDWQPYILLGAGLFRSAAKWGEQATHWGFVLQGGVGVRREIAEGQHLHFGYRQWHESNGSRVFGHDNENPGIEGGSFWGGWSLAF